MFGFTEGKGVRFSPQQASVCSVASPGSVMTGHSSGESHPIEKSEMNPGLKLSFKHLKTEDRNHS